MTRFGSAKRSAKRNQLRMRDGDNCWICGRPMRFSKGDGLDPEFATLDHVVPKSRGGRAILSNLKLAHGRCNRARGNSNPDTNSARAIPVPRKGPDGGNVVRHDSTKPGRLGER